MYVHVFELQSTLNYYHNNTGFWHTPVWQAVVKLSTAHGLLINSLAPPQVTVMWIFRTTEWKLKSSIKACVKSISKINSLMTPTFSSRHRIIDRSSQRTTLNTKILFHKSSALVLRMATACGKFFSQRKALGCNCVSLSVYNYLQPPNTLGIAQEWKQTRVLGVRKAVKTCFRRTVVHMFSFGEPEVLQTILNIINCLIETISDRDVYPLWQWKQHEFGNDDTQAFIYHLHHMSCEKTRCTT